MSDDDGTWPAIQELRGQLDRALDRIAALEAATPEARQLAYEADLAADGIDDRGEPVNSARHDVNYQCPWCYVPPGYKPGEADTAKQSECPCGYSYTPAGDCPGSWHGCTWHNEGPDPDDSDPGPECDDQGGMSEYRIVITDGESS